MTYQMTYQTEITLFGRIDRVRFATRSQAVDYAFFMEYLVGIPCHVVTPR